MYIVYIVLVKSKTCDAQSLRTDVVSCHFMQHLLPPLSSAAAACSHISVRDNIIAWVLNTAKICQCLFTGLIWLWCSIFRITEKGQKFSIVANTSINKYSTTMDISVISTRNIKNQRFKNYK